MTSHPRLWITSGDLPRLRAWAGADNPMFRQLQARAAAYQADLDSGKVLKGDPGTHTTVDYPTEMYAEFFAFMSLVERDPAAAQKYAAQARSLLMSVIDQAARGAQSGAAFRDPEFSVSDRSRWTGEAFALTVDWIYPALSTDDKAKIRTVFLRWIAENQQAEITTDNHPEPAGLVNDPRLVADPTAVRYAANNYYTAHMRNIGLMAMALDPADDPDGKLGAALGSATGAWLYVVDDALRHDARGGQAPEGFEYSPQTLSYVVQFLLALHTAGQDDPARWGPQVVLEENPFWDDMVTAYFHAISPATVKDADGAPVYQPAWYGDGQEYVLPDMIAAFGALGVYADLTGETARLSAVRWLETNTPTGGAAALEERAGGAYAVTQAILYFLLFDPAAPPAADPRPGLPLSFLVGGIGHLYARTGWGPDAAWFQYTLGWNAMDHQTANGNHFGFYRKGEWLTKERSGYANIAEGIASSEFENTLALENDRPPDRDPSDWRYDLWQRGSQWNIVASGDPQLIATSDTPQYTYAMGDSTNLYNSTRESSTDILYASRSILWLKPDIIFVYDRAASRTDGRFKRFWLQLPQPAQVSGSTARMATVSGQQLFVTSLLPQGAALEAVNTVDKLIADTASATDPMKYRLKIEAPGGPAVTRFLTVLQSADPGTQAAPAGLFQAPGVMSYDGVYLNGTLVMFPVNLPPPSGIMGLTYLAPKTLRLHLITGLIPGGTYDLMVEDKGDHRQVTLSAGRQLQADSGGVLVIKLP